MLTGAPVTVVLMAVIGLAVIMASVARILVLEHQVKRPSFFADPGTHERPRVAA